MIRASVTSISNCRPPGGCARRGEPPFGASRLGPVPVATFVDGVAAMQVIDAIRASAAAHGALVEIRRNPPSPVRDTMSRVAALLDRARQQTGLEEFGADGFREGLNILVASLDEEAQLNAQGRMAMDTQLVELLANRLQVEHWYRLHPEIDDQEIVAPLIGLGLPRTGSTALACLLGADPAARSIRNWESMWPCPPPDAATIDSDPRLVKAQASMERRARLFPRMTAMLPSTAVSPTECQLFMGYDFKSQIFQAFAHIPTYVEWLNHRADLVPTYTYVKRVLKLLQWHCPPTRWRLKNPSHSLFIEALDRVFPDARFVMTHRDVAGVVPSVADLYYELHKAYTDRVDLPRDRARYPQFLCARHAAHDRLPRGGQRPPFFRHPFRALSEGPVPHPRGAVCLSGRDG